MSMWRVALAFVIAATTITAAMAAPAGARNADEDATFQRLATFPIYANSVSDVTDVDEVEATAEDAIAEIIDVTTDGKTLVHVNPASGRIEFIGIQDPGNPVPLGTVDVGGEPTSLAIHNNWALVAVNQSENFVDPAGELVVVHINKQQIWARHDLNGQPDAVSVAPSGRYAAIAIENERDEDLGNGAPPQLPGGSLDIIDLLGGPEKWSVRNVDLSGFADLFPEDPEPEYVDINGDDLAVVTLQENNHLILVDLPSGSVVDDFSAGTVDLTDIDIEEEPNIELTGSLTDVPREPDSVVFVGDDKFATANEGDLDGGSRGFTIFDLDGDVIYDSGNSFEHLAVRYGHYPEERSGNKGIEPEGIEFGVFGERPLLFVGSERGNFVGVYNVSDPANPVFEQILPSGGIGPEGLKAIPKRNTFVIANEDDEESRSTVSVWKLENAPSQFPQLQSADDSSGLPIPWVAISGQASHPTDADVFYAVNDSFLAVPHIYTIDTGSPVPTVTNSLEVTDPAGLTTVAALELGVVDGDDSGLTTLDLIDAGCVGDLDLDLEGIVALSDGSFWVASEGRVQDECEIDDVDESVDYFQRRNVLVHVNPAGEVTEVVRLPEAVESFANTTSSGFEGVSARVEDGELALYAVIQRPWRDDAPLTVKVGRYGTTSGDWTFVNYVTNPVPEAASWVGLSEISIHGDTAVIIERDNVLGALAEIKILTTIDLDGVSFNPYDGSASSNGLNTVSKAIVRDLIPDFSVTNGWLPDKMEGLSIQSDGTVWISNDNDGLDDAVGETQLIDLGDITEIIGG